jgi:hypothetical protein
MLRTAQPVPDTIRIEVREMILATVAIVILAGVAMLWPRRQEGEEFVLTLPTGAPEAKTGDRVTLRAVADDGSALEGVFVVAKASGAWMTVRRLPRVGPRRRVP